MAGGGYDYEPEKTEAMKWIDIKHKLPEVQSEVIVTDGENVNIGYFGGTWTEDGGLKKSGFYEYENGIEGKITHWMPLPEPPNL